MPDWKNAPGDAYWWAVNANGAAYYYEYKPTAQIDQGFWAAYDGNWGTDGLSGPIDMSTLDWTNTLSARPIETPVRQAAGHNWVDGPAVYRECSICGMYKSDDDYLRFPTCEDHLLHRIKYLDTTAVMNKNRQAEFDVGLKLMTAERDRWQKLAGDVGLQKTIIASLADAVKRLTFERDDLAQQMIEVESLSDGRWDELQKANRLVTLGLSEIDRLTGEVSELRDSSKVRALEGKVRFFGMINDGLRRSLADEKRIGDQLVLELDKRLGEIEELKTLCGTQQDNLDRFAARERDYNRGKSELRQLKADLWRIAPNWAHWLAGSAGASLFFFEYKPTRSLEHWASFGGRSSLVLDEVLPLGIDWRTALWERE